MDMGTDAIGRLVSGAEETVSVAAILPLRSADLLAEALEGVGPGTWHFDTTTGLTTWDASMR